MAAIKIRQLIDLTIGFPEAGHVNFTALHSLLIYVAEKLGIADDILNYDEVEHELFHKSSKFANNPVAKKQQSRLAGGLNRDNDSGSGSGSGSDAARPNEPDASFLVQNGEGEELQTELSQKDNEPIKEESTEQIIEDTTAVKKDMAGDDNKDKDDLSDQPERQSDENIAVREDLLSGISFIKHQLDFTIEQLLLLTFLSLSKIPEPQHQQHLYSMTQTLNELRKEKIPIKGLKQTPIPFALSLDWVSSNMKLHEKDLAEKVSTGTTRIDCVSPRFSDDALECHLCYSPAKLLDQLMSLKSEFCLLTNNVNELSARLLQQESHHMLSLAQENHKQIRDIKLTTVELKANHSRLELSVAANHDSIETLRNAMEEVLQKMVDKMYFDMQLANKADYNQLQEKVSHDQLLELQCRIDKKFCEIFNRFNKNDKHFSDVEENLKITLGPTAFNEILAKFKENISNDMQQLKELLSHYIDSTNDDCTAAGARVKVLQDLACLSCNTNCVMPVREKAKLAKLPSAHATNMISPLVTYELSSIKKSGLMGYYRKDEFPHSPSAWLAAQQSPAIKSTKQSPTRHVADQHKIVCNRK